MAKNMNKVQTTKWEKNICKSYHREKIEFLNFWRAAQIHNQKTKFCKQGEQIVHKNRNKNEF